MLDSQPGELPRPPNVVCLGPLPHLGPQEVGQVMETLIEKSS